MANTDTLSNDSWSIADDHALRSAFIKDLLREAPQGPVDYAQDRLPRELVQYWDDRTQIPDDVQECLDSWAPVDKVGIRRHLFDDQTATAFIRDNLKPSHLHAFERCGHPAMRADFFRLCFMHTKGGIYVDADDVYLGTDIEFLFADGRLKLDPLCYDIESDSMLDPRNAIALPPTKSHIYYVNNNPLVAAAGHPVIAQALTRATKSLLSAADDDRDIQSLTGPGNLTSCLVAYAAEQKQRGLPSSIELLSSWDSVAVSKWPLEYRSDDRNWRHWKRGKGRRISTS